ncbi:MAG: DUF4199 domain-containing protein [Bacteroidota bacterium]
MKQYRIEIKWAVIFTVVALLWMVFERMMGWHDELIAKHATYTNFFSIVAIAVFVFALIDKRNNFYGGKMTYKQGFMSGLIISVIIALLTPLSQWITSTMITPDYFTNAINYAVESGQSTQEQAEATFNLGSYIMAATLFGFIAGVLTTAIVAIFVRKS